HECSPTDPYGWSGVGQDPLESYQGQVSTYLWKRQPLVTNPPPNWPGLASLPSTSLPRFLLLRLPATGQGANVFTAALIQELREVRKELQGTGAQVRYDPLRGALDIRG